MTAIISVKQHKHGLVHLLTDAAYYRHDQAVVSFATKVSTIPHWPGAVTNAGNAAASPLFTRALSQQFATWDDMVRTGNDQFSRLANIVSDYGLTHATVILVGYSAERRRPESYSFLTDDSLPHGVTREEANASPYYNQPYRLIELPVDIVTPTPPADDIIAANFEGFLVDEDPEVCVWSMRKALAMARHMPLPDGIGGIGGFAELTTVSANGVSQRVIERWSSDQLGAPLRHGPCDWDRWHADNPKPGQSKLKQDIAARKAAKFKLVQ